MNGLLDSYSGIIGERAIDQLHQLARSMAGMRVVHVNSTRVGGGVAEILDKMVPLTRELGIETVWENITGEPDFYRCTKEIHNALQGNRTPIPRELLTVYEQTNAATADSLREVLETADVVFVHDPQPAALIDHFPNRRGKWVWRCHIDASHPFQPVWRYLQRYVAQYDASIFSLAAFAQPLPHPQYIIEPSIDPLSDKNIELPGTEIVQVCEEFKIDTTRPLITQISRFDRFKDPVGVIKAFHLAKRYQPQLQLVLAGGSATDDPEGQAVLAEVMTAAGDNPDIHVLDLPPDSHRTINALQRAADVVLQKSTREGFGLTVTEGMWKGRPVIGGNTGGIRLQVIDHQTGFLVSTPEGAALRVRYLLRRPQKRVEMGKRARSFVFENFLLTRQLREYLTLSVALLHRAEDRIRLR